MRERPVSFAASCWKYEAWCDPTNDGCGVEQCSISRGVARPTFDCHTAGALAVGASCDVSQCGAGLQCRDGRCERLCCDVLTCTGAGEACVAIDEGWGTLGTCRPPAPCIRTGGACVRSSQCCSNDCHVDHCD
ncbi:MAG: hypothetical protein JNK82_18600 [Myxococcaceae bacterium]|nr:hypothetical protein [Myxococcaceae bacterium]